MVDKPPVTQNASTARPDSAASKQNVKTVEPNKVVKTVEEDDSSEDDFGTDTSDDVADSDEVFFQSKASHCSFCHVSAVYPCITPGCVLSTHRSYLVSVFGYIHVHMEWCSY